MRVSRLSDISRTLSFLLILLVSAFSVDAQVRLEYRHPEGDKWHISSEVTEGVLVDGELLYETEILNKISVEIRGNQDGKGRLWTGYSIAESRKDSDVYIWNGEFDAEYFRDSVGRISGLPEGSTVPAVRGVPVFPEEALFPGDSWSAPGVEVSDLDPVFGIPVLMEINFTAAYRYIGREEVDRRSLERISVDYGFTLEPSGPLLQDLQEFEFHPLKIEGEFHQEVLFDAEAGRNFAEEGSFSHNYHMSDGHVYTFRGRSRGQAVYVDSLDRDALVREIEDLDRRDIRAESVDAGVKVSLDDINFVADQPVMLPGQEDKLEGILAVLARYPDRDIQVVGHTARVSGLSDGQVLSERRAETVAQQIIDAGVRRPDQIMIRGMGNRVPVGDNRTEEGRRMNRRVEIIILEN